MLKTINYRDKFDRTTLQHVHVLFRHGDRSPDKAALYPLHPDLNESVYTYPFGFGNLTNLGRVQLYEAGKQLRTEYKNFLELYDVNHIYEAWSTDFNRTKMSLNYLFHGLCCEHNEKWIEVPPLPIKYTCLKSKDDFLLGNPLVFSREYPTLYDKAVNSKHVKNLFNANSTAITYINENTGLKIKTFCDLYRLYFGLYCEHGVKGQLPQWTNIIFPQPLTWMAIFEYYVQGYYTEMMKYTGGPLLKKIVDDSIQKRDQKKFCLYSAHEYNVALAMKCLGVFFPHVPPYASYLVIEYHKSKDHDVFKVLYNDYILPQARILKLPNCEEYCSFDKFKDLTAAVLPESYM